MIKRIEELVELLNKASDVYYNQDSLILTDKDFDDLYDELVHMENKTGKVFPNSPTKRVGYQVKSKLNKVKHTSVLLSLNKTKSIEELAKFIGNEECLISLKGDGLTTKLVYENGELIQAVTRGDGYNEGEDITHNILTVRNIPKKIEYKGKLSIVGESIIHYDDFDKINSRLPEDERYKNPRNLAAGSVRQLDSKVCAERNVNVMVFGLLEADGIEFKTKYEQLDWLGIQGFYIIPHTRIMNNQDDIESRIDNLKQVANDMNIPIDGLVLTYNDIAYGESLGMTSKFPRHSYAYKFFDEVSETIYKGLDVQTTRTGIVSLTATFDPTIIDGTEVSRASLHNVDIWESLSLGLNDHLTVFKANQIIPQVSDNLTRSATEKLPTECPTCKSTLEIIKPKEARFLHCPNPDCKAKLIGKLEHFVSRECMNIVGLSEQTLEKFIERGFINDFTDIYKLERYSKEIKKMDGFGSKSYNKLIESIENSKDVSLANFINALGISKVGLSGAKLLARHFNNDLNKIVWTDKSRLARIEGFGEVIVNNILDYLSNKDNVDIVGELVNYMRFKQESEKIGGKSLEGKVFVVTGSVERFKNRKELESVINSLAGKVSSSVSAKTFALINNDATSSSSKNTSAKKLGVQIITEEDFLKMIND